MWRKASVLKFLEKQGVDQPTMEAIGKRADEAAHDEKGTFVAIKLDDVMGDPGLARAYEEAWEKDVDLHL